MIKTINSWALKFALAFTLLLSSGCQQDEQKIPIRTVENLHNQQDFSFAIISDLNGGERPGIFEKAIQIINRLNPEITLSVGDLIDGGIKDSTEIQNQWKTFNNRLNELQSPFYYVGGNHDLSNIEMVKSWNDLYGPTYYHFAYKEVLFLMLNSEDFSEERFEEIFQARDYAIKVLSGEEEGKFKETEYYKMPERSFGSISEDQQIYFENVLEQYQDVRWTFLFMHKPLWKNTNNDRFHSIIQKMNDRNYSVFSGHEHSFSYQQINDQSFTILATTGGSQNAQDPNAFDHITWISMKEKPEVSHILLSGVMNEQGDPD